MRKLIPSNPGGAAPDPAGNVAAIAAIARDPLADVAQRLLADQAAARHRLVAAEAEAIRRQNLARAW